MYYITREIKYNKDLKKVLKKNIKWKDIYIKNKKQKKWKYNINYSLLGNSYEFLFQIEQLKKEKKLGEFHGLKYSRGKEIIFKKEETKVSTKILKNIYISEKKIMEYISGHKIKNIEKYIIYLTKVANIRNEDILLKIKINKKDIKQLKYMRKKFDKKIFKKIKNSTFSYIVESGLLIGEIDILEKNKIIDIKTTTNPVITREIINQQILYAILLKIETGMSIKKIGIYFEKYNILKEVKLKKIIKNERNILKYLEEKYRI